MLENQLFAPIRQLAESNWFWLRRAPPQAGFGSSLPLGLGLTKKINGLLLFSHK